MKEMFEQVLTERRHIKDYLERLSIIALSAEEMFFIPFAEELRDIIQGIDAAFERVDTAIRICIDREFQASQEAMLTTIPKLLGGKREHHTGK